MPVDYDTQKKLAQQYGLPEPSPFNLAGNSEEQALKQKYLAGQMTYGDYQKAASEFGFQPIPQTYEDQQKLAQQQAQQGAQINRPNITTPFGSETWQQGPDNQWSMNLNLTPDTLAALQAQQNLGRQRSQFAGSLMGQAEDQYRNPFDYSSLPGLPDAEATRQKAIDASYNQAASRLNPQWQQAQDQNRDQLYAMGFREGDKGYQNQMDAFNRQKTDAYQSAMNAAIGSGAQAAQQLYGMGMGTRQQALAEAMQQRNMPLNEMNALLTGQQVGMPQMPSFSQAAGPNLLGAANSSYQQGLDLYSMQQAQQQAQQNGLFGILGAGINAGTSLFGL
jgi:hypothetical protein